MQDGEPSRGILLDCKITPEVEFWYYLIYCKMTPYKYRSDIYCCTSLLSVSSAIYVSMCKITPRKKLSYLYIVIVYQYSICNIHAFPFKQFFVEGVFLLVPPRKVWNWSHPRNWSKVM